MSPKFSQMRPLVSMAIAGNDDIHKSLNEFEIRRDPTMDCGVGCP